LVFSNYILTMFLVYSYYYASSYYLYTASAVGVRVHTYIYTSVYCVCVCVCVCMICYMSCILQLLSGVEFMHRHWVIHRDLCVCVCMLYMQLLSGVEFMHRHWVIHRDLKTSNLLLDNRGQLKVSARQHTHHTSAYAPHVSIRQHTSAYVSIRQHTSASPR
jgi:hypothetical protein